MPTSEASAQTRRLRLPARPGGSGRPPLPVRFAAFLLAAAAVCALVASAALIIRGVQPVAVDETPDWYRDTLGSLLLALSLGGAASFSMALRRWGVPIVAVLCFVALGIATVLLAWGTFYPILVAAIPAAVSTIFALLVLALPPVRHGLAD